MVGHVLSLTFDTSRSLTLVFPPMRLSDAL